jgi:DNA repair protein RadD
MNLRDYQQQAISDLRFAMQQGAKAPLLCLPTGGGKTIILATIAAQAAARGRQVLILVHRRELIHQTASKLAWAGLDHGIIAAGHPASDHAVQIASVQTLVRRLSRMAWQPSLVIVDEAHHAAAGSWRQILEHWSDAYRLGVTATPCRLDGRGLSEAFDQLVMGPSVADLVFWGFLSAARIYAPPVVADLSGIRRRAGDYANDQAAAAMDRPTVTGDAIAHYQRLADGQQAIAFCCNVAHAVSVCDAFKTAGISAALLLGGTGARDQVVAQYAAGVVRVLVTVDVVSEGFDVPAASCAILLRPTQSLGLYLQQVGRVLRPAPGKDAALILDHVGNVTRHGFPDDPREWSLAEGIVRGGRGTPAPSVRTCPECYAAFKPAPQCPVCGAQCAPSKRKIEQREGELQELKREAEQFKVGMKVGYKEEPLYGQHVGPYTIRSIVFGSAHLLLNDQFSHVAELSMLTPWPSGSLRSRRGQARTLPQLLALAKERGYSPGWAYRIHQARGKR